jgi:hypothetical protein
MVSKRELRKSGQQCCKALEVINGYWVKSFPVTDVTKQAKCKYPHHVLYVRLTVQKQGRMQDLIDAKRVTVGTVTENRGRVGSTPPYSGGPSLKSQPLDRLSWLKYLVAFFILSRPVFPNQGSADHC